MQMLTPARIGYKVVYVDYTGFTVSGDSVAHWVGVEVGDLDFFEYSRLPKSTDNGFVVSVFSGVIPEINVIQ